MIKKFVVACLLFTTLSISPFSIKEKTLHIFKTFSGIFANSNQPEEFDLAPQKKIGIVYINGVINGSSLKYVYQLRAARENKEIAGVLVHIDSGGGSCGIGEGVRMELEHLAQVKPVVVSVGSRCGSMAYVIGSAAHTIFAPGSAIVGHIGVFSTDIKIDKEVKIDKHNAVTREYFYVGEDTLAGEVDVDRSSESYQHNIVQMQGIYNRYIQKISRSRSLDANEQHVWANGLEHYGLQAKKLGLIDHIGSCHDAVQLLLCQLAEKGEAVTDIVEVPIIYNDETKENVPQIAVINFGSITEDNIKEYLGQIQTLHRLNLSGILLTFNSFNIQHYGLGELLYREIKAFAQKTPIVSWIGMGTDTAGTLMASASNKIYITPSSYINSVGISQSVQKYTKPYYVDGHKNKQKTTYLTAGDNKTCKFPRTDELTDSQRKYIQDGVEEVYDYFCKEIATNRGLSLNDVDTWANGYGFCGPEAVEVGLVDELGSFSDAFDYLDQRTKKRSGNQTSVVTIDKHFLDDEFIATNDDDDGNVLRAIC